MVETNDANLLQRLNEQEDSFVERKSQGVKPEEIRQTLCAFANSLPDELVGLLFIGVDNASGLVDGVESPEAVQNRVVKAAGYCYPEVICQTRVLAKDGRTIVAVIIQASRQRPHFAGPAYVRSGHTSPKASALQYEELIAS